MVKSKSIVLCLFLDQSAKMQNINQVHKLLLLALVIFLAPFWIPAAIAVITITLVVLGGILTIFSLPIMFVILLFLLGVFGMSLLFNPSIPVSQRIQYLLAGESRNKEMNFEREVEMKDSWDAFT